MYCAAEPAAKPHIKLLKTISPENRLALATLLGQGRYRLRLQGSKTYGLLDVQGAGPGEVLWKDSLGDDHLTSAYFPTLALENTSREPKTFVLEEEGVDRDALRPADLFSLQGFRDLFSKEALSSDIRLEAGVQTILFTDLVGSTRFYVKEGDTVAFTQIRKHFQTAYEKVKAHDGAIVKTIGDAVMAAFPHPLDALRAAVELQRHFNGKNPETSLRVRATLHTGSCLAVNLNSNIDYFGNTVNLTAKIQSVAGAGQIGFTEKVMKDPEVSKFLVESGLKAEKLDFEMKWSGETIPVYRVEI
jgi:class 3 adenylate cyclase